MLPAEALPVLLGMVDNALHVNISQMTWKNPWPGKDMVSLAILSGNRGDMGLVLFALSVE